MVAVCCGLSWAEKREAKKAPAFEPVQVVSTVETYYPPASVALGTVVLEVTVGPGGEIQDVK
jgi:hypothetical protein